MKKTPLPPADNPFLHWQYPPLPQARLARFTDIDLLATVYKPPRLVETELETEARRLNLLVLRGAIHANGADGSMPLIGEIRSAEMLKHYLQHDDRLHAYTEQALNKMKDEKIYYRLGSILECPVHASAAIPFLDIDKGVAVTPVELAGRITTVAKRDELELAAAFGQFVGHRMQRRLDDIDARRKHVRHMQENFPAKRHKAGGAASAPTM